MYAFDQLGTVPYAQGLGIKRFGCHAGQRKLLLTEIQFLTCCGPEADLIIYIGSAPGEKMPNLLSMFPRMRFLLVDPNYHSFSLPKDEVAFVYQNPDAISEDSLGRIRRMSRQGTARRGPNRYKYGGISSEQKRAANAELNDHPPMYMESVTFDMTQIGIGTHNNDMRAIHAQFDYVRHKSLIGDIMAGDARVYIIQDYMSEHLGGLIAASAAAAPGVRIAMISDIRTNFFGEMPTDLDYMWNDALQLIVLKQLRPAWSMLKFHPPYMDYKVGIPLVEEMLTGSARFPAFSLVRGDLSRARELGLDLIGDYQKQDRQYRYIKSSTIWLQTWAPASSSEARLVVSRADLDAPWMLYDASDWDNHFMYLKSLRGYAYFPAFYEKIRHRRDHTYDGCFDCMLEIFIFLNYLRRRADEPPMSMNASFLAEQLKQKGTQDALIAMKDQINAIMVHLPHYKCTMHGHVVRRPEMPVFYASSASTDQPSDADRYNINQVWVDGATVHVQKILEVDYRGGRSQYKYVQGAKLIIARNDVPKTDDRDEKTRFGESCLYRRHQEAGD